MLNLRQRIAPSESPATFSPSALPRLERLLKFADEVRFTWDELLHDAGLTPARYEILELLAELVEGCAQTELAVHLAQSESNLCGHVDRLVAQGLVYRTQPAEDRRKRIVRLTEAGGQITAALAETSLNFATQLESLLGENFWQTFAANESRSVAWLTEQRAVDESPIADSSSDEAVPQILKFPIPSTPVSRPTAQPTAAEDGLSEVDGAHPRPTAESRSATLAILPVSIATESVSDCCGGASPTSGCGADCGCSTASRPRNRSAAPTPTADGSSTVGSGRFGNDSEPGAAIGDGRGAARIPNGPRSRPSIFRPEGGV